MFPDEHLSTVHPRPRGEHVRNMVEELGRKRFIPAHAGNTLSSLSSNSAISVHPRPRGEHVEAEFPGAKFNRFIPAHAGNTTQILPAIVPSSVHPRPRGEHFMCAVRQNGMAGSSPPTRGTLPDGGVTISGTRFIPAHAGNTTAAPYSSFCSSVHPRPRGEHGSIPAGVSYKNGSSPPTRGTRHRKYPHGCRSRFIPAHAGNTAS